LFGIEKPIDNDGVALNRVPSTRAGRLPINHSRPAIDGYTRPIGKYNFAREGNFPWIDSAMTTVELCTVPARALA